MSLMIIAAATLSCMNPRVVDGDTLICAGEPVRLVAINAREKNGTCRPGSPCTRATGKAATAELRRLTAGRRVTCQPVDTDRYGRTVARCRVAEADLSCSLVHTGHAAEWPQFGRACR